MGIFRLSCASLVMLVISDVTSKSTQLLPNIFLGLLVLFFAQNVSNVWYSICGLPPEVSAANNVIGILYTVALFLAVCYYLLLLRRAKAVERATVPTSDSPLLGKKKDLLFSAEELQCLYYMVGSVVFVLSNFIINHSTGSTTWRDRSSLNLTCYSCVQMLFITAITGPLISSPPLPLPPPRPVATTLMRYGMQYCPLARRGLTPRSARSF